MSRESAELHSSISTGQAALSTLSPEALFAKFSTTKDGIRDADRPYLTARHGKNVIPRQFDASIGTHIVRAITTPLSLVLCASFTITLLLGFFVDSAVIFLTLLIHVVISVYEDIQAAKSFAHVDAIAAHAATIITPEGERTIDAQDVLPGDIIKLVGGARVPADARLLESSDLSVTESAITGEWAPVSKGADQIKGNPDSIMVWHGTFVSTGFGRAIVVATGPRVKLFSFLTENPHHKHTPLQEELHRISMILVACVCVISLTLYLAGIVQGQSLVSMLLVVVAVAVAAIPSGLPAMMTVVLAQAMHAVALRGGKIKSISAAETCGSVTYILTDKTGTLTEGVMSLVEVCIGLDREQTTALSDGGKEVLAHAVRASDAVIEWSNNTPSAQGRPIESAIVMAGLSLGIDARAFESQKVDRIELVQFEPTRRFAISLNNDPGEGARVYLTGSPEHIAALCSHILTKTGRVEMTPAFRQHIMSELQLSASRGLRATAVAYRTSRDKHISEDMLHPHGDVIGFTFSGLLFFGDKVRTDVTESLQSAMKSGIRIVMVTGDHPEAAMYVANAVGLTKGDEKPIVGSELDALSDSALVSLISTHHVFARLLPEHKIRIAHVLQDAGERVAMTGDGVNDAGALIAADIGVVPESATDVAKDASDIVLSQSRISVIIDAIREGRRAFYNMQRILVYLLGTGLSEVMLVGCSLLLHMPLPLGATQILWANMIQEGCMSMPFARRKDADVLARGPSGRLLTKKLWMLIALMSITMGGILVLVYVYVSTWGIEVASVEGTMFVTLALLALFVSFPCADTDRSVFTIGATREHLYAACAALVLLMIGSWAPVISSATHGNEVPLAGWGVAILSAVFALIIVELYKVTVRYIFKP
jgi:Ca2+-transporting ATPase